MRKVSVATLKDGLSRYLEYVRGGGRIVVYRRDVPVAEIRPARAGGLDGASDRMRALERQGVVRIGSGSVPELLRTPPGGASSSGVLDALLQERASGR